MTQNKTLGVVGAGTMGLGIAQTAAMHGHSVMLTDTTQGSLDKAVGAIKTSLAKFEEKGKLAESAGVIAARVRTSTTMTDAANADVIIEAVYENIELKQSIFETLSKAAPSHALLGTNTSSLSITEIATASVDPTRVIGLHFFNPVPLMELLEIVVGQETSDSVLNEAKSFATSIKKTPIVVKDVPGFASSRLGVMLGCEAIRMLESGVASAEDIDKAMELGYRHPMGPLKLTDLVGLDVRLMILEHLYKEIGPQFKPPELLKKMVAEGKLGKKSGQGFYRY